MQRESPESDGSVVIRIESCGQRLPRSEPLVPTLRDFIPGHELVTLVCVTLSIRKGSLNSTLRSSVAFQ
jgi:hypothetical protein